MNDYENDFEVARAVAPYHDDAHVREVTSLLVAQGHRILQIFRFSEDDAEHVAALAALARFPAHAHVLDTGCGTGAVAEIMARLRPDLTFTLQNCSAAQLALCPDFPKIHGNMEAIDAPDGGFDGLMVNYAMGHADLLPFLREAARVVRPGGVFFAYDLTSPDTRGFAETLGYVPYAPADVIGAARNAGFVELDSTVLPAKPSNLWRRWCSESPELAGITAKTVPVAYRFVRGDGRMGPASA